jgi:hypothetical protein
MRSFILAGMAALILSVCEPWMLMAQVSSSYGGQTAGMFGSRSVGQLSTAMPTSGIFGARIQGQVYSSGQQPGMFGTRSMPQPSMPQPSYSYFGYPVTPQQLGNIINNEQVNASQATATNQGAVQENSNGNALEYNTTAPPPAPEVAPASSPESSGVEGANASGQNPGANGGVGSLTTANVTIPRPRVRMESASIARPITFVRSPELSDRLTRVARSKGMLASDGINVYLSDNNIALLRGAVRMPGDRATLANVVSLEPDVAQVDNRLIVQQSPALSANDKSR